MSNKMLISYELHPLDEDVRRPLETLLKSLMDWVQIEESKWIVLTNRHDVETIYANIDKLFKTKYSRVSVNSRRKTLIENKGYIRFKPGGKGTDLFKSRY
jgi:hypothetical protein